MMTRGKARELAAKWRAEGKPYSEVARMLAQAGYRSMTPNGVAMMLKRPNGGGQESTAQTQPILEPSLKMTLKAILAIPGLRAEQKLNIIETALN